MTAMRFESMRERLWTGRAVLWLLTLALTLSVGPQAAGAQEPAVLANWTSPPYWAPGNSSPSGEVAGGRLEAASEAKLAAAAVALPFFTLTPCRLADTRGYGFFGPFGLPYMSASVTRDFPIAGQCGIPATAKAVSFNFTVTDTAGQGFLAVYPQGTPYPGVSTLNFLAWQTIANAAVVPLGAGGAITAVPGVSGCDLIIDVNGYYAPSGIVSSLNTLTGDVTLAAGPNVTVTPSGNTLTISAPLTNLSASNVTSGVLGLSFGGTGSTSAFGARINLGAASLGANSDISSLSGLTTPLSVAQGGTGSATPFASAFQARVTGTCPAGSFLVSIASNGTVGCSAPTADPRPGFARSALDTAGDVGYFSSVAIGVDGLGLISYYDATNGDLKVAHCNDTACTTAGTATLDAGGDVGRYTSLAIGADGLGLISYYDLSNGNLKTAHCANTACSTASVATLDSVGDVGLATSVAIGADGLGLISYYDATNGDLKAAHCANTVCSSAALATLDSAGDVGSQSSLTIGSDGLGLIAHLDGTNHHLKAAHCVDTACSAATVSVVDGADFVGITPSVTVGSDGLGLISYKNSGLFGVKVAHCLNVSCTAAEVATVDPIGFAGVNTAITIGTDGLGLISYVDSSNYNLKVAHCSNTSCSSAAISRVDTFTYFDQSSVAIGTDGFGLITYHDTINGDLKALHCGNALCTPFVRRR